LLKWLTLSVVIPAYNEAERLPLTLEKVTGYLAARGNHEIIVVSDGSEDTTNAIVEKASHLNPHINLLVNQENRGKGYSVRKGVLSCRGEHILFMDADNSTPISELEKFVPFLNEYDLIIGSRALPGSIIVKKQPWLREMTGKLFNRLVQLFYLKGIEDSQCGFKLFKGGVARAIFSRSKIDRFCFDVEILYLAKRLGYTIKEVPITWTNSKPSKVSFFKDAFNILTDLVKIRWIGGEGLRKAAE
jgi:dolichyl-phosphate beta-glucosyltransferase